MKNIILILLVVHGIIHLMGFVKELYIAPVKGLSGETIIILSQTTKKLAGIAWLLGAVLITTFTLLWWMNKTEYWYLGAIGVVISQLVIILYWKDAKYGSIGNVFLLLLTIYTYGQYRFDNMVQEEIKPIITNNAELPVITTESILHLPIPVQQWLIASGVIDKKQAYNARLKQEGLFRISEQQNWTPIKAKQYFDITMPTFVWTVNAIMKNIPTVGRDKYANGKGSMLIKPLGLFTAVDADGENIDQGAMLRYLCELCWIPSAAIQHYLSWQQLDTNSAKVTMTYKGMSVSATFVFDELHRIKYIKAKRFMSEHDEQLTDWCIPVTQWSKFNNILIPTKGDVIWQLPDKDYNYYQWEITDIDYNIDQHY